MDAMFVRAMVEDGVKALEHLSTELERQNDLAALRLLLEHDVGMTDEDRQALHQATLDGGARMIARRQRRAVTEGSKA